MDTTTSRASSTDSSRKRSAWSSKTASFRKFVSSSEPSPRRASDCGILDWSAENPVKCARPEGEGGRLMGTGRIFGSIAIFASIVGLATWAGCGGSSNSQGVSFRSLGFFQNENGSVGESGTCASLHDTTVIPPPNPDGSGLEGGFLGLQNSMIAQGINVDHVNLSYHVNGSGLAIPSDVFALSVRLGPADGAEANGPISFSQIVIVSPAIMKFINDNASRLPDLPFTLV